MNISTQLSPKEFEDLFAFLDIVKNRFSDFPIVQGQFRSKHGKEAIIVETYFECFNQMEFLIPNIKSIVRSLRHLKKDRDISMTLEGDYATFSDGEQKFALKLSPPEKSWTYFLTESDKDYLWNSGFQNNRAFINETLAKVSVRRIRNAIKEFHARTITIEPEDDRLNRGSIVVEDWVNPKSDVKKRFLLDNEFVISMQRGNRIIIPNVLYDFDKSDMNIDVRLLPDNEPAIIHKTNIGNLAVTSYVFAEYVQAFDDSSVEC